MAPQPASSPIVAVPDDVVLLDRIRASDSSALDEALRRYWGPLLHYAAGIAADADSAEDGVQEVFVRLWARRERLRNSENLRALLFRMVRNEVLNRRRSETRRRWWLDRLARQPIQRPITPDAVVEADNLSAAVAAALNMLPPRRREAFLLIRHSGLTYREAAEVMGVSPQTVANQLSSALSALREALGPRLEVEEATLLRFPAGRRIG